MKLGSLEIQTAYFIGIAGIGMSALARHFVYHGVEVSGYDRDRSDLAKQLESEGVGMHYSDNVDLVPAHPDLVVFTPAIPATHSELSHYRRTGARVMKRAEVLGLISETMRCIAVAGTHGKTTTASMITYLLHACGIECTAFLGGISTDFNGNYVPGETLWMVAEADEYDRSFLQLSPEIAVITSMDPDHLDVYGSSESMTRAFGEFTQRVSGGGTLVLHDSVLARLREVMGGDIRTRAGRSISILTYGAGDADKDSGAHLALLQTAPQAGRNVQFGMRIGGETITASLPLPGRHNVLNAIGALAVCRAMESEVPGLMREAATKLSGLRGIRRRFEYVYEGEDLVIISDYAHHPEELRAAIEAAREQFAGKAITGVFQPHLYSRTADFYLEFAEALSSLDTAILVELYPAREQPIEGVSSELIFNHLNVGDRYCTTKEELTDLLVKKDPEVLLLLGAGDLDRKIPEIINALKL